MKNIFFLSTYKNISSYYIYFDVDDYDYYGWWFATESIARLKSPRVDGDVAQCLGFW